MTPLRFRPDIEGLRGIAIVLVVAYHASVPGFTGGFVGVDVFFTLSGYLITRLLMQELSGTGRVDLPAFYARRMRRLLPAALVMVAVTLGVAGAVQAPTEILATTIDAAAATLSVSNLRFESRALDYFGAGTPSLLLHTWSLSVEEQFYLAWPFLVMAAAGRRADRGRLMAVLAVGIIVSLAACWWWTIAQRPVAFFGTPYRAWEFAIGGLAAMLPLRPAVSPGARRVAAAAGMAGLGAIAYATVAFTDRTPFPGLHALLPVGGTAFILLAGHFSAAADRRPLVAAPWLQWLGRHSYGWYLWHWPLLTIGALLVPAPGPVARGVAVGASLLLAMASLRFVEEPVRRGSAFRARPRIILGGGLATIAAVGLLAAGLHQLASAALMRPDQAQFAAARIDFHACRHVDAEVSSVDVCRVGASHPVRTVVLFGDSHAAHWAPALEQVAAGERWEVLVIAKGACPSARVALYEPYLKRAYEECDRWRAAALDTLRRRRPALVLLANTSEYVVGAPYPSARTGTSAADWETGLEQTVAELEAMGSTVALIADTPRAPEKLPECLTLATWRGRDTAGCDFALAGAVHREVEAVEQRVVARHPGMKRLDLAGAICHDGRCRAWDGRTVLFRDTNHLTSAAGRVLAPMIAEALGAGVSE